MANFNFSDLDAVIGQAIEPAIRHQFKESATLYSRFRQFATGSGISVNQRGMRIPVYVNTDFHPWTRPDGIEAYTQLLRGEIELPHQADECEDCWRVFTQQIEILRSANMLAKHGHEYYVSRRTQISKRLRQLVAQTQEQAA